MAVCCCVALSRKPCFVEFVRLCGVNLPILADPHHQWMPQNVEVRQETQVLSRSRVLDLQDSADVIHINLKKKKKCVCPLLRCVHSYTLIGGILRDLKRVLYPLESELGVVVNNLMVFWEPNLGFLEK